MTSCSEEKYLNLKFLDPSKNALIFNDWGRSSYLEEIKSLRRIAKKHLTNTGKVRRESPALV